MQCSKSQLLHSAWTLHTIPRVWTAFLLLLLFNSLRFVFLSVPFFSCGNFVNEPLVCLPPFSRWFPAFLTWLPVSLSPSFSLSTIRDFSSHRSNKELLRSLLFIWAPVYSCTLWLRPSISLHSPRIWAHIGHIGQQDRRHLSSLCNPPPPSQ